MASQCYVSLEAYMRHWAGTALAAVQPYRRIYVGPNRRHGAERRLVNRRDDDRKGRRYRLADRRRTP